MYANSILRGKFISVKRCDIGAVPEIHRAISVPRLGKYLALVGNSSLEDALLLYRLTPSFLVRLFSAPIDGSGVAQCPCFSIGRVFGASDWLINPAILLTSRLVRQANRENPEGHEPLQKANDDHQRRTT